MEGPHGNNSSRVSKLKAFNGNVSPINSQRDNHQFFIRGGCLHHSPKSPTLDPYSENLDSALIRYLRSGSPVAEDTFKALVAGAMIGHQFLSGNSSSRGESVGYLSSRGSSSIVLPLLAVENVETRNENFNNYDTYRNKSVRERFTHSVVPFCLTGVRIGWTPRFPSCCINPKPLCLTSVG